MREYLQEFSVDFRFPVCFTRAVFSVENRTFVDSVRRLEPGQSHRVMFVIDSSVAACHASIVEQIHEYFAAYPNDLQLAGDPQIVPGGEDCKNDLTIVHELLEQIHLRRIDRQAFITVIGGGAVLDAACFAASIAHRGIRHIRIPTTVLAQADSGVGVKNGINFFGKKNFLGTFVPPFAVINDSAFIETLDHRDKIAGVAEAVKVALLRDVDFFEFIEDNAARLAKADSEVLEHVIRRCADLHSSHIAERGDPFELGSARPLDFGHWSAHKLESMTNHQLRHGEAVAIGIALDVLYSAGKGYLSESSADRILGLFHRLGFELWNDCLDRHSLLDGIQEFREHLGGQLHITLLHDIGDPFEVHEMDEASIEQAIDTLRHKFRRLELPTHDHEHLRA